MLRRWGVRRRAMFVLLVASVLLWSGVMRASGASDPGRIRVSLKLEGPSVRVGATVPVMLELLDQNFRPLNNDRDRNVRLELRSTGGAKEGAGKIAPTSVRIAPGLSQSTVRFTATGAGTVLVRATSDGLTPGEAVVRITSDSYGVVRLFFPTLHAQAPGSFELLPRKREVPLNRRSSAPCWLHVLSQASPRERVSYRVETDPPVRIKHAERETDGFAIIAMAGDQHAPEPFEILAPSRPGRIRIQAQLLPAGPIDAVEVEFVAPQPVRVGFERELYQAKAHDRIVPLNLRLLDQDGIPLGHLARTYDITVASAGGSFGNFEPPTVTLTGARAEGTSNVHLPWFRFGRDLKVLAQGEELRPAVAEIAVTATEIAVLLVAVLGGVLGGLVRHVYIVGTPYILPRRTKNSLDPGLVGNALFSALSGVVLYMALDIGILHGIFGVDVVHETAAFGFVLGVTGGFAGVLVFEALTARVIQRRVAV